MALAFSVNIVSSFPEEERAKLHRGLNEEMRKGFAERGEGREINVSLLTTDIEVAQWRVLGLPDNAHHDEVEKVVAMEKSSQ